MGSPYQIVTVLVVDDVQVARRIAARVLSEEGYRVLEADGRISCCWTWSCPGGMVWP
jgi:CheY-like chemotaxis protein